MNNNEITRNDNGEYVFNYDTDEYKYEIHFSIRTIYPDRPIIFNSVKQLNDAMEEILTLNENGKVDVSRTYDPERTKLGIKGSVEFLNKVLYMLRTATWEKICKVKNFNEKYYDKDEELFKMYWKPRKIEKEFEKVFWCMDIKPINLMSHNEM